MQNKTTILVGARGRLGKAIQIAGAEAGHSIFPVGRTSEAEVLQIIESQKKPFLVLDVSLPAGTQLWASSLACASLTARQLCHGLLVGSTGHSVAQLKTLEVCATHVPVCLVSNFSAGVLLFEQLLCAKTESGISVSQLAKKLGFDLAIWESHHVHKLDAPSGTAKTLAEKAGIAEQKISSTRVGKVVGEHSLLVAKEGEELRISHVAHTRELFANGAIQMAEKMLESRLATKGYSKEEIFLR